MRTAGVCAVLVTVLAVAGCGGESASRQPDHSTMGGSGGMAMSGGMNVAIVKTTKGDVRVGLMAMDPERFTVPVGDRDRPHRPAPGDNAHMMVTLADTKSGIRLPGATVSLRLVGPDGRVAYDGPLYPMIGRTMGIHYGENVSLKAEGRYEATVVVGPPRIGRHRDSQGAWSKPFRLRQAFEWDGKSVQEAG